MKKKTQSLILAVAVICFLGSAAFADVPRTTGTISKVTVYRGQVPSRLICRRALLS